MNYHNTRSYYQLNAPNILSTKRVPSLTPPKNDLNSNSKDKINKQQQEKASNSQFKAEDLYLPIQNAQFLQKQNTILSARKATINLSDSSDKLRKTSPNQKSPNNPRLSTIQKNKIISISQSQQAIAQVLVKMQENNNISNINKQCILNRLNQCTVGDFICKIKLKNKFMYFLSKIIIYCKRIIIFIRNYILNCQLYQIPELEQTKKSTINSKEYSNSSKHKTEDYQKLKKENLILQNKLYKLELKIMELQKVNQQLLNLANSCDCHQSQLKDLEITINDMGQIQEIVNPLQFDNVGLLDLQTKENLQNKRESYCQEVSEIKSNNFFENGNSDKIIEQLFEQYLSNFQELTVFKGLTKIMEQSNMPIPSVLKTLSLVINI